MMESDNKVEKSKGFIKKLVREYIEKHTKEQELEDLIVENNIEKRDIKGYHGREILELLQNADDAYQKSIENHKKPDCQLEVTISYKNNILRVTNTGTFFDEEGIKAIVQGNNSPKSGKYIGNKGTGFRSVLNWAEKVRIFSGSYNVEFSKEKAAKILDSIRNKPQIQKQLKKNQNLYIPMLAVPDNIESNDRSDITTIEIVIDQSKLNDDFSVSKQIENIDLRILLFLPNVSKIDITTESSHIIYERSLYDETNEIFLRKYVDGELKADERYSLFERKKEKAVKEDDILKDIHFSVAVPEDPGNFSIRNIYSFFPLLDTVSPFNCVLHATYALGDHRNTVNLSKANKEIIKEQLLFLIDVAKEYVKNDKHEIAYKLLIPANFSRSNGGFTPPFNSFELEDYYYDLLSTQKIFQTVNNEHISINDGLKIITGNYPSIFAGKNFSSLLKPLPSENVVDFIDVLAERKGISVAYKEKELLTAINSSTDSWSVSQQVEIFIWWNTLYKNTLPNLLKTQKDIWLRFKEDCYFLIGDLDDKGLPSWVKIPALRSDYQQELFLKSEKTEEVIKAREKDKESHISRIISQNDIYQTVEFKYRDRSSIISPVNSSVDTYNKSIYFVKWLWKNYRGDANWNPPGRSDKSGFKYNFPCVKGGSIKDSEKLFLGSDYNNPLGAKLFDEGYGAFPPASVFDISDNDTELFKDFICKFGVKEYPEIETQEVSPIDTYSSEYEKEIRASGELGQSTWAYYKYNLPYIKGLEDLLKDLSTTEIVEWIIKDKSLYSYLSNPYYTSNAEISFSGYYQKYRRTYRGSIKNYILEVFNEVRWIEIGGKRCSPRQILQNFINSKNNNKFKGSIPVIDNETLVPIAKKLNVEVDKVYDVFKKFEFADKVTDLCSEDFYGLMLNLPTMEFSKSAELSQIIYRIVEQSTFSKSFEDSDNKKEFFEKGKVLVNYKGQLQYFPAKDAFLPSIMIVDKRNVPIVKMGTRKNIENFVRLFNCQKYNRKYSVIEESISISPANADFQKYYDEFKKYARAYAEKNDNIERHARDLRISLVNKISISENGKTISIDEEYEYIRDTITSWYIIVFDTHFDINTVSEIIENIYANIANTSGFDAGKLGELFRAKDKSDREFLIKKEFGSLSVIEDDRYKNDIRNSFIETLRSIIPAYDIEEIKINFDDFFNIENTPLIIELFKEIGTDADSFMKAGFGYAIDLVPYYKKELKSFIQRERRRFKNVLFTRAKADEKLQPHFFDTIDRFENFFIQDFKNTVTFDIEKIVVDEFGEWRDDETVLSADDEYAVNYEAMNRCRKFEDIIAKDKKVQLMIYFNKTDEFNSWLEVNENREQKNEIPDADYYSRFKNVVPHKNEIAYNPTANTTINSSSNEKNSSHSGSFNQNELEKRRKNQKRCGNIGEQLIYNLLCEQVGEENVFPRSEAFLDLNIRKPGQTVSGEYDMSYIDNDGIEYFAEVKTGDGKSFIITPGELQFAKENAEKYKLFIVYNIDSEIPDYLELPIRFWEDDRYRKNEVIERIEFEF